MKKLILASVCLLTSFGIGGQVYAQTPSLTLSPAIIEVADVPGATMAKTVTVRNDSSLLIPVKIEVSDYSIDENGIPSYASEGLGWTPLDWISIEPSNIILSPNEEKVINLDISIPEGAVGGSHVAAIIFKPIMPPEYFETQSTHIIPYIGAVVGISVETEGVKSSSDFLVVQNFNHSISEDMEGLFFNTTLRNEDVYYHKVEGDITVSNLLNNVVVEEEVKGVTLFPESSREFKNTYASRLPFGRYTATLNVGGEGDKASESVTFWVEPTVIEVVIMISVLLGAILVITLLILLIVKRKNVIKSINTLFKK